MIHNSGKFIGKCLDSLIKNWPQGIKREILLIDNCLRDKTVEKLKNTKNIRTFELKNNEGFAKDIDFGTKKFKNKNFN